MAAILGRENRVNQEMREGLPHRIITAYNCVIVSKLGRPFRAGLRLRIAPRAKAPGLFCFPPSGEGLHPTYLNAYRQLPDIENRLERPRQLKRMRMALNNKVYAYWSVSLLQRIGPIISVVYSRRLLSQS